MFKTAPRYLSGVSVFYGDDITRRTVTGEIAFVVGQAIKGPRTPIALSSVDNAINLYGKDSPLLKGLYEFWDGYLDSPKAQNLQIVTLRTGGKEASLVTPFGVTIQTADAYTSVEDEYYVYINNNASSTVANIKVWDTSKQKVYDSLNRIDGGYVTVIGTLDGTGGVFGKDIDSDPFDVPATLKTVIGPLAATDKTLSFINQPTTTNVTSSYSTSTGITTFSVELTSDQKAQVLLADGWLIIDRGVAANHTYTYINYDAAVLTGPGADITVLGDFSLNTTEGAVNLGYISKFALTQGDSELTSDPRAKYELFRNGLLDIEQFTPDYIIPAGIYFDEVDTFDKTFTYSTNLVGQVTADSTEIIVDGASNWNATGNIDLFNGTFTDQLVYSSVSSSGTNYLVTLDIPTALTTAYSGAASAETITVTGVNAQLLKLRNSGFIKFGAGSVLYKYTNVVVNGASAVVTLDSVFNAGLGNITAGAVVKAIGSVGADFSGYLVSHSFSRTVGRDLGIGYVKETDIGGSFTFEWANVPTVGYGLAHFGYLFANFCNEAAVGYNTPLCGMSVDTRALKASQYTRASIVSWIGSYPTYQRVPGVEGAYSGVLTNGSGLLGNAVVGGTIDYNRTSFSDVGNSVYADPGFGFLLTEEGYIDGTPIRDNFYELVDLGKFMVVGAGLLTFANGSTVNGYIDACGAYSLGMLAGKPKNEGLSYSRIGLTSNASVSVVVHRKYYNDLANCKYIVVSREKGLGWVINNGDAIARDDSGYKLISTTRILKYVVEGKREALSTFIGKALNQYYYEAAKTKLASSFKDDVKNGLVNGFTFDLQIEAAAAAIGKLYLKLAVNPPFELTQVTIDTIIDRTVTSA